MRGRDGGWAFGRSGSAILEEEEVSSVQDGEEEVTENDGQLIEVERVDERDEAAPEAEVPEEGWDDDFAFFF